MIKKELLSFLSEVECIPRKAIRLLGYNYIWIGRVVKQLIDQEHIKVYRLKKTRVITITAKGRKYVEKRTSKEQILNQNQESKTEQQEETIKQAIEKASHINREDKQERLLRQGWVQALLYRYSNAGENSITNSLNKSFYKDMLSVKREDEKEGLLIRSSRAHGVIETEKGILLVYNAMERRMQVKEITEERLKIYLEKKYGKPVTGSIMFAKERVFWKLITEQSGKYLGDSAEQVYYAEVSETGAKQVGVYIWNTRKEIAKRIIPLENRLRADGYIYDGISADGEKEYIAIEMSIPELRKLKTIGIFEKKQIKIYCFSWQRELLERALQGSVSYEIKVIDQERREKSEQAV